MIPAILATSACGKLAGAAVYVSQVEHPARLSCDCAYGYQKGNQEEADEVERELRAGRWRR
jgi:hypothetical protein